MDRTQAQPHGCSRGRRCAHQKRHNPSGYGDAGADSPALPRALAIAVPAWQPVLGPAGAIHDRLVAALWPDQDAGRYADNQRVRVRPIWRTIVTYLELARWAHHDRVRFAVALLRRSGHR